MVDFDLVPDGNGPGIDSDTVQLPRSSALPRTAILASYWFVRELTFCFDHLAGKPADNRSSREPHNEIYQIHFRPPSPDQYVNRAYHSMCFT